MNKIILWFILFASMLIIMAAPGKWSIKRYFFLLRAQGSNKYILLCYYTMDLDDVLEDEDVRHQRGSDKFGFPFPGQGGTNHGPGPGPIPIPRPGRGRGRGGYSGGSNSNTLKLPRKPNMRHKPRGANQPQGWRDVKKRGTRHYHGFWPHNWCHCYFGHWFCLCLD